MPPAPGFQSVQRTRFTDEELIAELRKRASWRSGSSQTFCNVMTEAANRLEQLLGRRSED